MRKVAGTVPVTELSCHLWLGAIGGLSVAQRPTHLRCVPLLTVIGDVTFTFE